MKCVSDFTYQMESWRHSNHLIDIAKERERGRKYRLMYMFISGGLLLRSNYDNSWWDDGRAETR